MEPITPLSVYQNHYKPGDPESTSWCKNNTYSPIRLGWIYSSEMKGHSINTHKGPSYSRITAQTQIHDNDNYEIIHRIEIKDNQVYLNDHLIGSAPAGKNKVFKDKFCKAIVWSLMNDFDCLKDKLNEINTPKISERIKPIFPAGFIPWLNLSITEEVCTA